MYFLPVFSALKSVEDGCGEILDIDECQQLLAESNSEVPVTVDTFSPSSGNPARVGHIPPSGGILSSRVRGWSPSTVSALSSRCRSGCRGRNHTRAVRLIVFLVAGPSALRLLIYRNRAGIMAAVSRASMVCPEILVVDAVEVGVDHHFGRAQIVYNPVPFLTFAVRREAVAPWPRVSRSRVPRSGAAGRIGTGAMSRVLRHTRCRSPLLRLSSAMNPPIKPPRQ